MNVSEQLLQMLVNVGVTHVYGVVGDALNHLVKAIEQSKEVDWVAFKHEGNASFAAFGDSESSGKLAVCAGTVGPGALHLINGLYNAKKERTPVLAITGQVPSKVQGTSYFQEVDLTKVYDDVCAYQAIVRTPQEAPMVMQRALQIAISQRTVCRIELAADIAGMPAASEEMVHPIFHSDATLVPGAASIHKAATAINAAHRIGILAGRGCRDARKEVLHLANKLKAPITHTLKASDIFD
ncbi:MAG TPA: thiamine pyrophosphate-binding protein, partial [Planctomycetota bacterium]|nr:thiamine pyrophosphate-binding protein [Planctomycetota bacterium]